MRIAYGDAVAVESFTADVEPGVLTVLSGPSGSGKSSIVGALLGFVPFTGDLQAAGHDAKGGSALDLLAWSGQSATLFRGTVAENVALGDDHPSAERVAEALDIAVLGGLDPAAPLDERGSGLSGGQSQRVAIARAVYRLLGDEQRILVLDEPSAALDHETEARLVTKLRALAHSGRAVLVVSHREAFLSAADVLLTVTPVVAPALDAASDERAAAGTVRS